jgi:UDP-N-acetylglucosamine 2-epimerase
MSKKRRVAVLCTARPSFAKLQPIIEALRGDGGFDIDIIAAAYDIGDDHWPAVDSADTAL